MNDINLRQNRNINFMVGIYLFLLLLNTAWQTVFGMINPYEGISALVIYLLPVVFYWYFRKIASEQEIRSVLLAIVVAGLIVGMYFVYDSYLKLALGQVSDYAYKAFQYSLQRSNQTKEMVNQMRIGLGRGMGLLESHSVSGAWVILGSFAALFFLPPKPRVIRRVVFFVFGMVLLLGLNFTSIITFSVIMLLFEFGGLSLLRGRLSAKLVGNLVSLTLIVMLGVGFALWVVGEGMSERISKNLVGQINLLFGTGDLNIKMGGILIEEIGRYFQHILSFPHTLLLGDGFSTFGMMKGGDIGAIESLAKFGVLFFLAIVFGLLRLIKDGLRQIKAMSGRQATGMVGIEHGKILQFAICVTLLVLITEGHYNVWSAKSILPIVFFVFALYSRYLSVPRPVPLSAKKEQVCGGQSPAKVTC